METVTSLLTHFADYWRDIAELLGSGHLLEEIYSIHKTDEACLRALVERQVEEQTLSDDKLQDIIEKMKGTCTCTCTVYTLYMCICTCIHTV